MSFDLIVLRCEACGSLDFAAVGATGGEHRTCPKREPGKPAPRLVPVGSA